jgi:hypothetical protein
MNRSHETFGTEPNEQSEIFTNAWMFVSSEKPRVSWDLCQQRCGFFTPVTAGSHHRSRVKGMVPKFAALLSGVCEQEQLRRDD